MDLNQLEASGDTLLLERALHLLGMGVRGVRVALIPGASGWSRTCLGQREPKALPLLRDWVSPILFPHILFEEQELDSHWPCPRWMY